MYQHELEQWICDLPKVELHLHIEGTLEPELMFDLAKRNGLSLGFTDSEELKRAYNFQNLQSFLNLYYEGSRVLLHERDFFDLTWAYLRRVVKEKVRHVEIFFDPQAHMNRGVDLHAVISGIHLALEQARTELRLSSKLIPCFLRDLTPDSAMQTLGMILAYRDWICAVGLDSSEAGRPPELFQDVFDRARTEGLLTVAHAGEEGPPEYIWQALELLKVARIDHGIRCLGDESLVQYLAHTQIPLTVCPISNVKLKVFQSLDQHNVKLLLQRGLCVSIHSDDPAYFGGYITENYLAVQRALHLQPTDILQLARNGVKASFLSDTEKEKLFSEIQEHAARLEHSQF
jgi:adenosine deaminase